MVTKESLAQAVAARLKCSAEETKLAVNAVLEALRQGIITDGKVELRGLFTAKVVKTRPHRGRNPKTGERVEVPAGKAVKFRLSPQLRKAL